MNEATPILIVEDNDEDFEMLSIAFEKAKILNPVHRCQDGQSAIEYLFHSGEFVAPEASPRPGLVLMDLNLSGYDGRYVLTKMKNTDALRSIPVIILTTSANPKDVEHCYSTGIAGYMVKPVNLEKLERLIQLLKEFWLDNMVTPEDMNHGF